MQSQSKSEQAFIPLPGEALNQSQVSQGGAPSTQRPEAADSNDDVALAKAPTVVIEEDTLDSPQPKATDLRPTYYVQGVIQGEMVYLITNLLGRESQTLFQSQRVWTIGRNREAALPLRDRALSRRHAVILYVPEEGFHLIDLNSMNGSFVNGVRIRQRQPLKDGDHLCMGSLEFSFFTSGSTRTISPIHPEILTRFTTSRSRTDDFIDYDSLEESDVWLQSSSSSTRFSNQNPV